MLCLGRRLTPDCSPVGLQGNCSSALPVGLPAFIASDAQLPNSSAFPLSTTALDSHSPPPVGTSIHPAYQSSTSSDALAPPEAGKRPTHGGRSTRRQIGMHASAAWEPSPEMAGCGPLLPSWRQLTDLLVPLLHKVGSMPATPVIMPKRLNVR